jgi:hypothetical protein
MHTLPTVSESDSDDDDIPLGILQAHNFPSRTKAPDARFSQNSYARPASAVGSTTTPSMNNRTSLPVFARGLPQDPYGSTSNLMQNQNRSSFFPPPGQSPVPGMPPGGLVGVIAEEEKMKSYRRGNTVDNRNSIMPQMGPAGMNPGMSMGMQGLSIPGLNPGMGGMPVMNAMQDQSQINQQLLQVVQQQTMMLQAMYAQMQTMATPSMDGQSMLGGLPQPGSIANENMRPGSPRTRSMVNLTRPPNAPRTMSMVNTSSPFAQNWSGPGEPLINSAGSIYNINFDGGGYAPSVAPSERSNVGNPHRYRPVSNLKYDTASTVMGVSSRPVSRGSDAGGKKKKSGFFSALMHPKGKVVEAEEEEDWSNFAKKRRSAMPTRF